MNTDNSNNFRWKNNCRWKKLKELKEQLKDKLGLLQPPAKEQHQLKQQIQQQLQKPHKIQLLPKPHKILQELVEEKEQLLEELEEVLENLGRLPRHDVLQRVHRNFRTI